MSKDYYKILGVQKDANEDALKKAFRTLAKKHHPDLHQSNKKEAEQKFKDINEAYDTLKDPQKRAAYDRYGPDGFNAGGGFGSGGDRSSGSGGAGFEANFDDLSDIFSTIFGGGSANRAKRPRQSSSIKGADLGHELEITLEEAYNGKKQTIRYTTAVKCDDCGGKGSKSENGTKECGGCYGTGRMRSQQGFFTVETTCSVCNGSGSVIKDPCNTCRGNGRVNKQKTVIVNIPAGIDEGERLRIVGEGEAGLRAGSPGDLYVLISIKEHKFYQRAKYDLRCHVPIRMKCAILGGYIEIPGIDHSVIKIKIPEGTQHGTELRIKGKGMRVLNKKDIFGDLFLNINVETPVNITSKQKKLIEDFDDACDGKSSPQSDGFFSKIKNLFK